MSRFRWTFIVFCAVLLLLFAIPGGASTTHFVTSNADSGPESLRAAIENAQANDVVAIETIGPISLQSPLTVSVSLEIRGAPGRTLIDGSSIGHDTILMIPSDVCVSLRLLEIYGNSEGDGGVGITIDGGEATLESCVIRDNAYNSGPVFGAGGGVYIIQDGRATLIDCLVSNNRGSYGGGISIWSGSLDLIRTDIIENTAVDGGGGGVFVYLGDLRAEDCQILRNTTSTYGGGISHRSEGANSEIRGCTIADNTATILGGGMFFANCGLVTVDESVISGNISLGDGGGILTQADINISNCQVIGNSALGSGGGFCVGDNVLIERCTVRGNSAGEGGGGIDAHGWITVQNCLIEGNTAQAGGGGIRNVHGVLRVSETTISGNSSEFGGGLEEIEGTVMLSNCTVSSNEAAQSGGGIWNSGWAYMQNCTLTNNIAENDGGGIYNIAYVPIKNCIVALNHAAAGKDVLGALRTRGWNLIGDTSDCDGEFLPTDILDIDPLLDILKVTGDCMPTHSLLSGSPAIDAGSCFGVDDQLTLADQCGNPRPIGQACDIGAVESSHVGDDPPTASFTHEPSCVLAGEVVAFTDTSIDEGPIVSWSWSFGDDSGSTVQNPTHIYTEAGIHIVTLSVTDNSWESDTATEELHVYVRGDLNGDDNLDVIDVLILYRFINGVIDLDSCQQARADIDEDGDVDLDDAQALADIVFGL